MQKDVHAHVSRWNPTQTTLHVLLLQMKRIPIQQLERLAYFVICEFLLSTLNSLQFHLQAVHNYSLPMHKPVLMMKVPRHVGYRQLSE